MVRLATENDIPRLVEMGRHFRNETSYAAFLAENPEKMAELGRNLLKVDGLLLAEHAGEIIGMLGFIVHDHFISGERVGGEIFWWVEPNHRGDGLRLLHEAEKLCKQRGAASMQMIAPTAQLEHVYQRLRYSYVEATYQKKL